MRKQLFSVLALSLSFATFAAAQDAAQQTAQAAQQANQMAMQQAQAANEAAIRQAQLASQQASQQAQRDHQRLDARHSSFRDSGHLQKVRQLHESVHRSP